MKPRPASPALVKHATTIRSARFALTRSAGPVGSSRGSAGAGPPGAPGGGGSSMDRASAGGGVPIARRRGSAGPSPAAPRPSSPARKSPFGSWSPPGCPAVESVMGLPVLRSDPQRREHHEEQQPEEGHQPFG